MGLQYGLEIVGTFVFAVSGALAVREHEHDLFWSWFYRIYHRNRWRYLAEIFLLDSYPLVWIADVTFLYAIFAGIFVAFIFPNFLSKLLRTLSLFDTLGIAFFTVLGVEKSLSLGVRPEIAAIMGMFSAVMGGVIRDTLTNVMPVLFRKEVYAAACMAGAIFYLVLNYYGIPRDFNLIASILVIIAIRMITKKYKWSLPRLD